MCGSPPPHHFILGSVSTLKWNDFSEIKTFMPPSDHFILGILSTLKCNDLSVLKHLCGGPLHHSTLSWVQFHNFNVMTFLHGSPSSHHYILGLVSTYKCDDLSALKHLSMLLLHHITLSQFSFNIQM